MWQAISPNLINTLAFVFILGLAILVHELGHFAVARALKIKVEEFAIGFGPQLAKWHWWGTLFTIRAIPLGGFNKIRGEGERVKKPDSYSERPFHQKFAVLVAGALMNFVLAIVVAQFMLMFTGFKSINPLPQITPPVGQVVYDQNNRVVVVSVAEWSSLITNKEVKLPFILTSLDQQMVTSTAQVQQYLHEHPDATVTLKYHEIPPNAETITTIDLSSDQHEVRVAVNHDGKIGIGFLDTASTIDYGQTWLGKFTAGVAHNYNNLFLTYQILKSLIQQSIQTHSIAPVGESFVGIVGFYKAVDLTRQTSGFWGLLNLITILNLNLGIMNLLPIPTLDGGHIAIRLLERLSRRRWSDQTIGWINLVGFVLLIILAIAVTVKDIWQFIL